MLFWMFQVRTTSLNRLNKVKMNLNGKTHTTNVKHHMNNMDFENKN